MNYVEQYIIKAATGLLAVFLAAGGGVAHAEETEAAEDIAAAPEETKGIGRLQQLELKAEERDRMAERSRQLEEELLALQQKLGMGADGPRSGRGRLDMLERKAAQFEQVVLINEAKTEQIRLLGEENEELRMAMDETEAQYMNLNAQYETMVSSNQYLHGIIQSLHQTVDQLLLGNFEYYTVQREGETLVSIAGMPMVYNDTNKVSWLVEPNKNRVKNLNQLEVGDVLVVPRFPASGKYVW